MEKNIIHSSNKVNILYLVYCIINEYKSNYENIISFTISSDDFEDMQNYYIDSNNCLTKNKLVIDSFRLNENTDVNNREFDADLYIKRKIELLTNNLNKFWIDLSKYGKQVIEWEYELDEDWNEDCIKEYKEIYSLVINVDDINILKVKLDQFIEKEILDKEFEYSTEKISDEILSTFITRWKNNIIINPINYKRLNHNDKDSFGFIKSIKSTKYDLIKIVYYDNVIELFIYKLYLEWYILSIESNYNIIWDIEKVNKRLNIKNIIKLSNDISYDKDSKIILHKNVSYPLVRKQANQVLLEIILDNYWKDYDSICWIEEFYRKHVFSRSKKNISEQIHDTFYKITSSNSKYKFLKEVINGKKIIKNL